MIHQLFLIKLGQDGFHVVVERRNPGRHFAQIGDAVGQHLLAGARVVGHRFLAIVFETLAGVQVQIFLRNPVVGRFEARISHGQEKQLTGRLPVEELLRLRRGIPARHRSDRLAGVAGSRQHLLDRHIAGLDLARLADLHGRPARQQGGRPRLGRRRAGEVVAKARAGLGQAIEIGGLHFLVAISPQHPARHLVRHDQHHVGLFDHVFFLLRGQRRQRQAARRKDAGAGQFMYFVRAYCWTQLAHALAQAVFFFNPAMYWIGRRLKIEREMACDDWVVSTTGEARPYAACLTHLHELTRRAPAPQLAPGATGRTRWQISARVEALLRPDRNSTARFSRSGWMAASALVSAALMLAARTTMPVGVQEIPAATTALAQLRAPAAPLISLAPRRAAPARPRLTARHVPKPELPASPALIDAPVVLVRAWQVEVSPTYFVIAVVFFEPPPHTAMHGI